MIPEEMIISHLDMLLSSSDPGDQVHHLHVIDAPRDSMGPFGLPDESKLNYAHYFLVADGPLDTEEFVARAIMGAGIEHAKNNKIVLFAGLSQEMWGVVPMDELGQRLLAEGRLQDHPNVAEATVVYAACRDGRRWRGRRWLTGRQAGKTEDVELLVGKPHRREAPGIAAVPLILRLVGLQC